MSDNFIKPYELSLWKDKQYFVCYNSDTSTQRLVDENLSLGENETVVNDFFAETKLGILGTEELKTPIEAYNLKLTRNINGKNELTFTLRANYWNSSTNEICANPWKTLVVNEQKVKLHYDNTWFDFIIKKTEESSDGNTITYTCEDLFIEELSKNGYDIELNGDLMNNMGTITTLATTVLDGSEWQLADDTEIIRQFNTETMFDYENPLTGSVIYLTVMQAFSYDGTSYTKGQEIEVPVGDNLYIFYSSVVNEESNFQVLYSPSGKYILDSNSVILNAPNCYVQSRSMFAVSDPVVSNYRGKKLIESPKSTYITALEQVCTEYKYNNEYYYCQEGIEYLSAENIKDLITNNISFTTTDGWYTSNSSTVSINRQVIGSGNTTTNLLTIHFGNGTENWVGNNGFAQLCSNLSNGLISGDKYTFLVKPYGTSTITSATLTIQPEVSGPSYIYSFSAPEAQDIDGYIRFDMMVGSSLSYNQLVNAHTITFQIFGTAATTTQIIEAKLFLAKTDDSGNLIIPNVSDVENSIVNITYKMFKISKAVNLTSADDLVYDYNYITIPSGWEQQMEDGYAKVTSITAEKTNRFNLIQDLAEKFECWAKFDVHHATNNGRIEYAYTATTDTLYTAGKRYFTLHDHSNYQFIDEKYYQCSVEQLAACFTAVGEEEYCAEANYYYRETDTVNAVPDYYYIALTEDEFNALTSKTNYYTLKDDWQTSTSLGTLYEKTYEKYVGFHEYIGQDNHIGFRYGVNLTNIKRSLDSDAIVTKLIVTANANEYAEDGYGSCSIANSQYNSIKENFILNLDYYIKQGILDESIVLRDLYNESDTNGIGYLRKLERLNKNNTNLIQQQSNLTISQLLANATYQQYKESRDEAKTDADNYSNYLTSNGITKSGDYYDETTGNDQVKSWAVKYNTLYNAYQDYEEKSAAYAIKVAQYEVAVNAVTTELARIATAKEGLNQTFNTKYSRYLREGSWISEDYTSADKYYLDAKNVLQNSAYPQVSYIINVADVSALDEYSIYAFKLADETYVEDTEFFGKEKDGRPVQEKVVVTAIIYNLNEPSNNTITVKNYDNRWESLFQKITATTNSLQFHEGEYNRVADTVDETGTIKSDYLKSAFSNNPILADEISREINEDGQGIELINQNNNQKILRMGSSGIALTQDGGTNWTTAITAEGINASKINTGQLNTENIRIFAGSDASFVWDKDNLTAYAHDGSIVSSNKYVQFNQSGLQGYNNTESPVFKFGYDGFELASTNTTTYTEISATVPFVSNHHYFIKSGDTYTALDFDAAAPVPFENVYTTATALSNLSLVQDEITTQIGYLAIEGNQFSINIYLPSTITADSYEITVSSLTNPIEGEFKTNNIYNYTETDFSSATTVTRTLTITYYNNETSCGSTTVNIILRKPGSEGYYSIITLTDFVQNIHYYIRNTDTDQSYTDLGYLNYPYFGTYYRSDVNGATSLCISTNEPKEASVFNNTSLRPIIKAKKYESNAWVNKFILYDDGSLYANNVKLVGDITATSGTFSGRLESESGYFGGITLDNGTILIKNQHESAANCAIGITASGITLTNGVLPNPDTITLDSDGLTLTGIGKDITINGGTINLNGGSFLVQDGTGATTYGWMGYATGARSVVDPQSQSSHTETTYGIGLTASTTKTAIATTTDAPYLICTLAGIRMSAGVDNASTSTYNNAGIGIWGPDNGERHVYYKQGGSSRWTELGTAHFG